MNARSRRVPVYRCPHCRTRGSADGVLRHIAAAHEHREPDRLDRHTRCGSHWVGPVEGRDVCTGCGEVRDHKDVEK